MTFVLSILRQWEVVRGQWSVVSGPLSVVRGRVVGGPILRPLSAVRSQPSFESSSGRLPIDCRYAFSLGSNSFTSGLIFSTCAASRRFLR